MSENQFIYQIYDKIFKKILTLSTIAVINLINGLFGTNYPPDSTITYNWTEHITDKLRRCLADTILTINGIFSYHMEAQITEDEDIVFRVFDYGYAHAIKQINNFPPDSSSGSQTLYFPEAKIIYLFSKPQLPDQYCLNLDFGSQGSFSYNVTTFKLMDYTIEELNKKKMIILIPFVLLKFRDKFKKKRANEDILSLKRLIFDDIITSIDQNMNDKNITENDAYKLKRLTHRLYEHLFAHYPEMEELNEMTDEALILDIDILEDKYERLFEEREAALAKSNALLNENKALIAEMDLEIAEKNNEIAEKDNEIAEKDSEIAMLKAQLAKLQSLT